MFAYGWSDGFDHRDRNEFAFFRGFFIFRYHSRVLCFHRICWFVGTRARSVYYSDTFFPVILVPCNVFFRVRFGRYIFIRVCLFVAVVENCSAYRRPYARVRNAAATLCVSADYDDAKRTKNRNKENPKRIKILNRYRAHPRKLHSAERTTVLWAWRIDRHVFATSRVQTTRECVYSRSRRRLYVCVYKKKKKNLCLRDVCTTLMTQVFVGSRWGGTLCLYKP